MSKLTLIVALVLSTCGCSVFLAYHPELQSNASQQAERSRELTQTMQTLQRDCLNGDDVACRRIALASGNYIAPDAK